MYREDRQESAPLKIMAATAPGLRGYTLDMIVSWLINLRLYHPRLEQHHA